MKKVYLLAIVAMQSAAALFSQTQNKPDTMTIRIGGEHISLPVPKEGNKTTINLEDSVNIIQISVARTAKNRIGPAMPLPKDQAEPKVSRRKISWLHEVEFGAVALLGAQKGYIQDDTFQAGVGIGSSNYFLYSPYYSFSGDRATIVKMTPKTVSPGFSLGISVREKSRPIRRSSFYLVSGFRLRYSRYETKGEFDIRDIKVKDSAGFVRFYPDSVYSKRIGEYKTTNSILSFVFPFVVEKQIKTKGKNAVKIGVGMNLVGNLLFTRTRNVNVIATNIQDAQILRFQPIIRASINRTSFYVSLDLGQTVLGAGSTQKIYGNLGYFGLAYKLY